MFLEIVSKQMPVEIEATQVLPVGREQGEVGPQSFQQVKDIGASVTNADDAPHKCVSVGRTWARSTSGVGTAMRRRGQYSAYIPQAI